MKRKAPKLYAMVKISRVNSLVQDFRRALEANFPSDPTLDHHPQRTSVHYFSSKPVLQITGGDDNSWVIGSYNVAESCRSVKSGSSTLDPSAISELRLV